MFFVKYHIPINEIYNLLLFFPTLKDITTKTAILHNVKLHKILLITKGDPHGSPFVFSDQCKSFGKLHVIGVSYRHREISLFAYIFAIEIVVTKHRLGYLESNRLCFSASKLYLLEVNKLLHRSYSI